MQESFQANESSKIPEEPKNNAQQGPSTQESYYRFSSEETFTSLHNKKPFIDIQGFNFKFKIIDHEYNKEKKLYKNYQTAYMGAMGVVAALFIPEMVFSSATKSLTNFSYLLLIATQIFPGIPYVKHDLKFHALERTKDLPNFKKSFENLENLKDFPLNKNLPFANPIRFSICGKVTILQFFTNGKDNFYKLYNQDDYRKFLLREDEDGFLSEEQENLCKNRIKEPLLSLLFNHFEEQGKDIGDWLNQEELELEF